MVLWESPLRQREEREGRVPCSVIWVIYPVSNLPSGAAIHLIQHGHKSNGSNQCSNAWSYSKSSHRLLNIAILFFHYVIEKLFKILFSGDRTFNVSVQSLSVTHESTACGGSWLNVTFRGTSRCCQNLHLYQCFCGNG